MYGISQENKAVTSNFAKRMPAGIHENITLDTVVMGDWEGTPVLDFNFSNEDGEVFAHRVFPIDEKRELQYAKDAISNQKEPVKKKKLQDDLPNAVKKAYEKAGNHMLQILQCFVTRDEINAALSTGIKSFADYGKKIIALLDGKTDEPLRIKLTLNKKDRTQFPKSTQELFIQPMSDKNRLSIDPKWDKILPDAPSEEEAYEDTTDYSAQVAQVDAVFGETAPAEETTEEEAVGEGW